MYTCVYVRTWHVRVWYAYIEIYLQIAGAALKNRDCLRAVQLDEDNYTPRYSLCYDVILYLLNKDSN